MRYLNFLVEENGEIKSGHPRMRTPIMLCFKAKGIHTAPPSNSYNLFKEIEYLNFTLLVGEEVA